MDAHYDPQVKSVAHTNFSEPARQMGSGRGLRAFAVRMGRVAIPLVKKYVLPVARQVVRNLLETAIPEIGDVLAGKKKLIRKLLANVAKKAAAKTMKKNMSGGVARRPAGGGGDDEERNTRAARRKANDIGVRPMSELAKKNGTVRQAFREKQPPKEVGCTFCLKLNIPKKNTASWHPSTIYLSALQPRLQGP